MVSVKELKSIDLSSYTIILTGIAVLFSVIAAILTTIGIGILMPGNLASSIYLIPTIIVGAFICTIYNSFSEGLFYNLLVKKLNSIKFSFNDKELVKISTTETATIIAIITTIQIILIYLVSSFVLPIILNATVQTLMFAGQQGVAYTFYQLLVLYNQPATIALIIFGTFILTFVFVLIGTYIYNILGTNGKGATISLSKENEWTLIDSIEPIKLAIAFAIISGVLNIIIALIMIILGNGASNAIGNIIGGFIGGFIEAALFAIFYNYLAPKLGKLKLELIDQ